MKPVNVLLIAGDNFPPNSGGVATTMFDLASSLNVDSLICLTSVTNPIKSKDGRYHVHVSNVFNPDTKARQLIKAIKLLFLIKFRYRPNLIILDVAWTGNVALWFKKIFGWPLIIFAHGGEILKIKTGSSGKSLQALQKADRLLANSHYCRKLLKEIGIESSKIQIVYRGINIENFYPLSEKKIQTFKKNLSLNTERIILTVANLNRMKGQDMVIKAIPLILREIPDLIYLIVGHGRDEAYIRDVVKQVGVEKHVRFFTDVLSKSEVNELYNISDVFVMPSRTIAEQGQVEGFGIAYLEANACGKPVIGGKGGGVPDAVLDGQTGLLVDSEDIDALAKAIIKLFKDKRLAAKLGEQGRQRVINRFSVKHMCRNVENICHELLNT